MEIYILMSVDNDDNEMPHRAYEDEVEADDAARVLNAGRVGPYSPRYYVEPVDLVKR